MIWSLGLDLVAKQDSLLQWVKPQPSLGLRQAPLKTVNSSFAACPAAAQASFAS